MSRRSQELNELTTALGRVQNELATLAERKADEVHAGPPPSLVNKAAQLLAQRRRRAMFFPAGWAVSGEPVWDMLLDLFVQEARGSMTRVSSLCGASGVPLTTALRWIGKLERLGLLTSEPDHFDGRVRNIALTHQSRNALTRYLENEVMREG